MGFHYSDRSAQLAAEAEARAQRERKAKEVAIHNVAARVAMIVIDEVNRVVVRPGPAAEERECYEMAQEIRDTDERLTNLIADILKVAIDENQFSPPAAA